ncbi:hypothetical protein EJ06DRAFT_527694 [Trichodelitschia bisporula]|uniref:Uncharacterized protein n=1 Tax=Trichodelitschia bisporula TaxID=703511 RepID=A0A6G1I331_9PEZI|nr:hypothetical protein EJ06DRAFT_527694 [Trichodelitschia bisporula]
MAAIEPFRMHEYTPLPTGSEEDEWEPAPSRSEDDEPTRRRGVPVQTIFLEESIDYDQIPWEAGSVLWHVRRRGYEGEPPTFLWQQIIRRPEEIGRRRRARARTPEARNEPRTRTPDIKMEPRSRSRTPDVRNDPRSRMPDARSKSRSRTPDARRGPIRETPDEIPGTKRHKARDGNPPDDDDDDEDDDDEDDPPEDLSRPNTRRRKSLSETRRKAAEKEEGTASPLDSVLTPAAEKKRASEVVETLGKDPKPSPTASEEDLEKAGIKPKSESESPSIKSEPKSIKRERESTPDERPPKRSRTKTPESTGTKRKESPTAEETPPKRFRTETPKPREHGMPTPPDTQPKDSPLAQKAPAETEDTPSRRRLRPRPAPAPAPAPARETLAPRPRRERSPRTPRPGPGPAPTPPATAPPVTAPSTPTLSSHVPPSLDLEGSTDTPRVIGPDPDPGRRGLVKDNLYDLSSPDTLLGPHGTPRMPRDVQEQTFNFLIKEFGTELKRSGKEAVMADYRMWQPQDARRLNEVVPVFGPRSKQSVAYKLACGAMGYKYSPVQRGDVLFLPDQVYSDDSSDGDDGGAGPDPKEAKYHGPKPPDPTGPTHILNAETINSMK